VTRFFTEAKAVNDIHHENIVDIIDFGRSDERVYILMELLAGEGLRERLERGTPPEDETVHIVAQAASALAASHRRAIIHRDLKPENIFLTRRSHDRCFVKLLDFGIAKLSKDESAWKTRTGALVGTPRYMSPEQCAGRSRIDFRSDIYSLGVVMYELITGRVPFSGETMVDIMRGHLTVPPPPPSTFAPVSPALESIVMKCLEKPPGARFSSMDELRAALASPAQRKTVSASSSQRTTLRSSVGELTDAAIPRRRGPLVLVVATALAGVVAAIVALRPAPPPHVSPAAPTAASVDAPATAPADERVRIRLDSSPPGAVVTRAGQAAPLGVTPFTLQLKKGEPPFEVRFVLDGSKDERRTLSSEGDQDLRVAFEPAAAPAPLKKPPATRHRAPHPGAKPPVEKAPGDPLDDRLL
jgi:serine/threonine-protein kinase